MFFVFLIFMMFQNQSFAKVDISKPTNEQMFSSRSIYDVGHNLIIYGNRVVMRQTKSVMSDSEIAAQKADLDRKYQKAVKKAQSEGKPPPQKDRFIGADTEDKGYKYKEPPDGCYILENGFEFCCTRGQITKIINGVEKNSIARDYFFYDLSPQCKAVTYHTMYNFLYKNRSLFYHQYQLRLDDRLYPSLIRIVIFNENDLLSPDEIDRLPHSQVFGKIEDREKGLFKDEKLIAVYISENNEIGCLPFKDIKFSSKIESNLYKIHLKAFKLVQKWIPEIDLSNDLIISILGPFVSNYRQSMIDEDDKKLIIQKGTLEIKQQAQLPKTLIFQPNST